MERLHIITTQHRTISKLEFHIQKGNRSAGGNYLFLLRQKTGNKIDCLPNLEGQCGLEVLQKKTELYKYYQNKANFRRDIAYFCGIKEHLIYGHRLQS